MGPPCSTFSHIKRGPKWSFPGRRDDSRMDQQSTDLPGPGQYGAPVNVASKRAPQFAFGCTPRGKEGQSLVPGPGAYQPEKKKNAAPAFTLTPRRNYGIADRDVPGPGAHNLPEMVGQSGPKYGFTHEERHQNASFQAPGPATYRVQEHPKRGQTWKFGTAARQPSHHTDTPGPGSYTLHSSLGGPKFSAAPRREETRTVETPGPVTYKLNSEIGSGKQYSMSARVDRIRGDDSDAPGPGHYSARSVNERAAPRYGFGTENRGTKDRTGRLPGPGAYTPAIKSEANKWKFSTASRGAARDSGSPGPGWYNDDKPPKVKGPQYSLGSRCLMAEEKNPERTLAPGPGEYNQELLSGPSPRWGFGTSARLQSNQRAEGPGPGTYAAQAKTFAGPRFGFPRSKRRPLANTDTPGPGAHEAAYTQFGH